MTTLATQPPAAGPAVPDGQPEQRRILVTELPGPRSRELQQRRDGSLPPGLGTSFRCSSIVPGAGSWSTSTAIT